MIHHRIKPTPFFHFQFWMLERKSNFWEKLRKSIYTIESYFVYSVIYPTISNTSSLCSYFSKREKLESMEVIYHRNKEMSDKIKK